ncbi:MAG: hypothetical protein ACLRP3_02530 [Escherichia sp.]
MHRRLLLVASTGVPPTNLTIAGRRHREATHTCGFSNCAITQVSSSIVNANREEQTFNGIGRAWNQRSPVPKATKIHPLRAITVTIELNVHWRRHPSLLYRQPSTD